MIIYPKETYNLPSAWPVLQIDKCPNIKAVKRAKQLERTVSIEERKKKEVSETASSTLNVFFYAAIHTN